MSAKQRYSKPLVCALLVGLGTNTLTSPVVMAASDDSLVAVAEKQSVKHYQIPAGTLERVLNQFAREAGILLSFDSSLVEFRNSNGLKGEYTLTQGLGTLLKNTGIHYRLTDDKSVVLEPSANSGDEVATLDTIRVEAVRGISAWGETDGFVSYYSDAATKTDTPLQETPQAISVIGREEIDKRNADNISEVVSYSTGVKVDDYGVDPRGYGSIRVRGYDTYTNGNFRDGLPTGGSQFAYYTTDPYVLERVDIMHGPSGALYGQGDAGGVVDKTTKRPRADMENEVRLESGSFNHRQGAFDVGGRLADNDDLLFRLTGVLRDSDTEFDYANGESQDNNRLLLAPSLRWDISDDTRITFLTEYLKDDRGAGFGTYDNEDIARTNVVAGEPDFDFFEHEQYSLGYLLSHRFNDVWSFRQNMRFYAIDVNYQTVYPSSLAADGRTLSRYLWAAPNEQEQFSIDNQLEARLSWGGVDHTLLFGLDYTRSEDDYQYYYDASIPTLDLLNPVYSGNLALPAPYEANIEVLTQKGLYLQDQIKFNDAWVLTLGGRYSHVRKDVDSQISSNHQIDNDYTFTGRVGLTYLFENGLSSYASYTEGFVPVSGVDAFGSSFEPEESEQFEVGLKYELPDYNGFLTVALFDLTKNNVLTRDPSNIFQNVQTGEVNTKGLELEGKVSLLAGLDMTAAYSVLDAEVTKSNNADLYKTPVQVPKHLASLWLNYRMNDGDLRGLEIGGGFRYVGSQYSDLANTSETDSYTLLDATVRYHLNENITFALDANNLLDKEYLTTCSSGTCYWGQGQRLTASVKYRWK